MTSPSTQSMNALNSNSVILPLSLKLAGGECEHGKRKADGSGSGGVEHIMLRSAGRREVGKHKAPADELQRWLDTQKAKKSRARTTFGIISLVIQHLRCSGKHFTDTPFLLLLLLFSQSDTNTAESIGLAISMYNDNNNTYHYYYCCYCLCCLFEAAMKVPWLLQRTVSDEEIDSLQTSMIEALNKGLQGRPNESQLPNTLIMKHKPTYFSSFVLEDCSQVWSLRLSL